MQLHKITKNSREFTTHDFLYHHYKKIENKYYFYNCIKVNKQHFYYDHIILVNNSLTFSKDPKELAFYKGKYYLVHINENDKCFFSYYGPQDHQQQTTVKPPPFPVTILKNPMHTPIHTPIHPLLNTPIHPLLQLQVPSIFFTDFMQSS